MTISATGSGRMGSFEAQLPSPINLSGVQIGADGDLNRAGGVVTGNQETVIRYRCVCKMG